MQNHEEIFQPIINNGDIHSTLDSTLKSSN